jgi:hypothetical protein
VGWKTEILFKVGMWNLALAAMFRSAGNATRPSIGEENKFTVLIRGFS